MYIYKKKKKGKHQDHNQTPQRAAEQTGETKDECSMAKI